MKKMQKINIGSEITHSGKDTTKMRKLRTLYT